MKARDFFDRLRMYPELDVNIFTKVGDSFVDIRDISCDANNGDLIIYLKNDESNLNVTQWKTYIEYLKKWAEDHKDELYAGMSPVCFDEWEEFDELEDDEEVENA